MYLLLVEAKEEERVGGLAGNALPYVLRDNIEGGKTQTVPGNGFDVEVDALLW